MNQDVDMQEYWEIRSEHNFYRATVESARNLLTAKRPDLSSLDLGLAINRLLAENKHYAEQLVALTQPKEKSQ